MSIDTSAFFGSPVRNRVESSIGTSIDIDSFFDGNGLLGARRDEKEDEFTDGTSPKTGATTPARSDGWVIEEEEIEEDNVKLVADIEESPPESPREATFLSNTPTLPPIKAYSFDGKEVIIKRKPVRVKDKTGKASSNRNASNAISNLVKVPLHRIMEELASETAKRLDISPDKGTIKPKRKGPVEETLWTDKYRPRQFTDLLGDERVHRETMSWVKEWDTCVFPERTIGKRKKQSAEGEEFLYQDEYHRPREKILLLSGPPGLGKTTLAHVVARQAGYSVMEINASDARSGGTIEDRIRPVLEAGSSVGSSKPVLVIIDEIDGATGGSDNNAGFVHKLIALTFNKPKKGRSKDRKDTRRPLLRPVICICNDLYASSLAKLRPIARIVRFQKPAAVHLVKRLKEICEMEDLKADSRGLAALVGISQGDMRGCLNTLQLLKTKHPEITETIIRKATLGMKESESSFMEVLTDIFTPLSKSRVKDLALTSEEENRYVNRINRGIDATGSLDKVALACFENYPNYRVHDANFGAYEKAHEWLAAYDQYTTGLWQDREYAITPYLSYTLAAFYPLFATKGGPKLERPHMDWEAFQKKKTYEEIYKTMVRNVLGDASTGQGSQRAYQYRHLVSNGVLQLEFAPLLNRIISPPLKPVNKQVIKQDDKLLMERVVAIMVALDLRFVQEKSEDGVLVYRLDPPIDVFVTYDEKKAADIAVSRYATRHLIAAEIDAVVIEKQAEAFEESTKPTVSSFFNRKVLPADGASSPIKGAHDQEPASSPVVPTRKRKREEQEVDIADRPPVDFFGRLVAPRAGQPGGSGAVEAGQAFKVSYRYNEGMSAAVRKPAVNQALEAFAGQHTVLRVRRSVAGTDCGENRRL